MKTGLNNVLRVEKSILKGQVKLSGAKNSALKLMVLSILTNEEIILNNFPNQLSDIMIHSDMLEELGKYITKSNDQIVIRGELKKTELNWEGRSIRNTLLILGALVSRYGYGKVPLPGGCKLGDRKIDLHLLLLRNLGAEVWQQDGYLIAKANKRLKGAIINLSIRSTGATENGIISSVLASGKTIIFNPHIRPEIIDLIDALNEMGANIVVNGNESIEIIGVNKLSGLKHKVMPDNMEAITFLIAAVMTKGEVEIFDFPYDQLKVPIIFLESSGAEIYKGTKSIIVKAKRTFPFEISTGTFPGINSDMQPLFAALALTSKGISRIVDLRFSNRFQYVDEFNKMGGDLELKENILKIKGGNKLNGKKVIGHDLRANAALLLLGLVANGMTIIDNSWQITRGYEDVVSKFKKLGARIDWI